MLALLRVLAEDGLINEDLTAPKGDDQADVETAVLDAIFDRSRGSSLRRVVDQIHRLASIVRDRISTDTWNSIRQQNIQFIRPRRANSLSGAIEALDQLLLGLAGCRGLIHDGMIRGPAWQFLDMGRSVERSHWIRNVMESAIADGNEEHGEVLDALVDVFDCRITYRMRYMSSVQLAPLMDLLLCDETNPGSLASQVHGLSDHIRRLPRSSGHAEKTEEQRHMLNCVHRIELADIHKLCEDRDTLCEFVVSVVSDIDSVASEITRRYLVHAGDFRQVSDEAP